MAHNDVPFINAPVGSTILAMRIGLAQIDPTVGDIAGNCRKILDFISRAKGEGAQLVVFPELAIIGYPPKDLLLKPQFIDDNLRGLSLVASRVSGIEAIVGYAERNRQPVGRPLHNAVAVLRDGKVASTHFKTLLPTYDVFDETRYFEPGPAEHRNGIVRIGDIPVGLSVCEDLWNDERLIARRLYHQNPIAEAFSAGAEVMVNSSASPFVVHKHAFRLELFGAQAKRFGKPLVYVNQVGGNDELVFDGNSVVFDAEGRVVAQAKDFEEDLLIVDVGGTGFQPVTHGQEATPSTGIESIYKALILGLRDYVRKCGFRSVVLGLSGGIDSAVTGALAVAALGADKVVGVSMPSRFSSDHSIADARQLARNLGIEFRIVEIKPMHDSFEQTLAPVFTGTAEAAVGCASAHHNPEPSGERCAEAHPTARSPLGDDLTEQNIQARIRGVVLMAFSNRYNHLLLTTGNKSEVATGYCTLYGDMAGGLAVISDVPKTSVYALAEFINKNAGRELIPRNSITKPPSAELRPNQTDQDSLPPYDVLDAIMHRYIEEEKSIAQIIADGFDAPTVVRVAKLIDKSEYKRRQAAPGIKVTSRAFGFGRRMPIAQRYEQTVPKHGEVGLQEI